MQKLLRTSSCLRQEGIDEARWTFLIVRREEVEAPPQLIPQGHAVKYHPSHHFRTLAHVLLGRPGLIFRVRNHPETEISLPVVNLIDDLDHADVSARHQLRPSREGNRGDAVEEDLYFAADVQQRGVDPIRRH